MAILKYSAPVDEVRGSVAGITYSRNGSSCYAKRYAYPLRSATQLQADRRSRFSQIRADWNQVTPAQYADWAALAAEPPEVDHNSLGDVILLNAAHWHTRINMRRLQAGDAIERACPVNTGVAAPDTFGLTIFKTANVVDESFFEYTDYDFDDFYAVLQLSLSSSPVRTKQTTRYTIQWCAAVEGLNTTRINEELITAFGALQTGAKIFGRLYKQSQTGIRSTYLSVTTIVQEET